MTPSFLICGIEHCGTTLLSDFFRQTPHFDSGFEVGVLLSDKPRNFRSLEPFISNIRSGWGLNNNDLDEICDTDNFADFYAGLWDKSTVVDKRKNKIFDKTPRYLVNLESVAKKGQFPIVICYKDPRAIVASDFMRSKQPDFAPWYKDYMPKKIGYMKRLYHNYTLAMEGKIPRCHSVALENLCLDTRNTLEGVFAFIGEPFDLSYLTLKGLRYAHTKSPYIASNIPFEYLHQLSPKQISRICDDFSQFSLWFYH
ncbi:MAG: sulfotransferase [Methylococcaceae bacterium]